MPDEQAVGNVNSYYRDYWREGGFFPHGESWPGLEQLLAEYLPANGKVIDIGCGDALTTGPLIISRNCRYVGVDLSDSAVTLAKRHGFEAYRVADASELPFEDSQFDAAVCIEVLEHLFLPHLAAKEIFRVLKPGGMLIATVPNAAHWRKRIELGLLGLFDPYGDNLSRSQPWRDPHIRFFTPVSLGKMLHIAGFDKIVWGGDSTVPMHQMKGIRRVYWSLHRSVPYQILERVLPGLLSFRAHAIGFKPNPDSRAQARTQSL